MRILLADDDHELRFILARVLLRDGFEVEEMRDFQSLFRRLSQVTALSREARKGVVLVSDVYLPGGTSLEAVRALGEDIRGLPMIFITSARDDDLTYQGMQLGATAVLSKPVDLDELKRLLHRMDVPPCV